MLFSVSLGAVLRGECRRKEQRRKAHTLRHQHLIDEKEEAAQPRNSKAVVGAAWTAGCLGPV